MAVVGIYAMNALRGVLQVAGLCSIAIAWNPEGDDQWWKNEVIYQIYPRSFKDSNGDGVGDLHGIISKLDHLKDIGVAALWLSPMYPSPQVDAGYDISNYTDVHEEYGTLADFDELQKRANKLGLKMILDLVPNHSSNKHPWFIKSEAGDPKYKDYYVWKNAKDNNQPPNNWLSNFRGSAWEWSEQRKQYYLHQFGAAQPDLNYENPAVVEEMKNVIRFWMDRGVYGFRMDAVPYIFENETLADELPSGRTDDTLDEKYLEHIQTQNHPKTYDMLAQWRKVVEEFGKDKFIMTESFAYEIDKMIAYYGTKEKPGAHFPFNFLVLGDLNRTSDAHDWKRVIDKWRRQMDGAYDRRQMAKLGVELQIGNHDNHRVGGRYGLELADGINMISLTLPGTALTYNGEEINMDDTFISWNRTQDPIAINKGQKGYLEVSRDPSRTPMQWDDSTSAGFSSNATTWMPVNPNYWSLNLAAQKAAKHSPLKIYKDLLEARKHETLKRGDYKTFVEGNVFIIMRTLAGNSEVFVTAVNFGDEEAQFTLKEIPDVFVYTASMNADHLTKGSNVKWPMKLRPKASVLLSNAKKSGSGWDLGWIVSKIKSFIDYIFGRK